MSIVPPFKNQDQVVWKASTGYGKGIVVDAAPENGKLRVSIPPYSNSNFYIDPGKVFGIICPRCGTGDRDSHGGWLRWGLAAGWVRCSRCKYEEEREAPRGPIVVDSVEAEEE